MSAHALKPDATACLALANGQVFWGRGFGAQGQALGELCFNTSMTGYQEVMTDPSYAEQIVAFTFPHIGNVGANAEDNETGSPVALGMITRMAGQGELVLAALIRAGSHGWFAILGCRMPLLNFAQAVGSTRKLWLSVRAAGTGSKAPI